MKLLAMTTITWVFGLFAQATTALPAAAGDLAQFGVTGALVYIVFKLLDQQEKSRGEFLGHISKHMETHQCRVGQLLLGDLDEVARNKLAERLREKSEGDDDACS